MADSNSGWRYINHNGITHIKSLRPPAHTLHFIFIFLTENKFNTQHEIYIPIPCIFYSFACLFKYYYMYIYKLLNSVQIILYYENFFGVDVQSSGISDRCHIFIAVSYFFIHSFRFVSYIFCLFNFDFISKMTLNKFDCG